jgi:hypothetical protein
MGDRTAIEDIGFGDEPYWEPLPDGVAFLVDQEANYGNAPALRELGSKGCIFVAQHDAGGEYDASRIASDGQKFCEVDARVHEQRPCVPVNEDGSLDKHQLKAARQYWRTYARARLILGFTEARSEGRRA